MIEGTKGGRKPLRFCLHKYPVLSRGRWILCGQSATQRLVDFRFRQPAEEIRKEWDLVALGDEQIYGKPPAKPVGDRAQPFLPVPAATLQPLRIGGGTRKFFRIKKTNDSAEAHPRFGFAPKPPPEGDGGLPAQRFQ